MASSFDPALKSAASDGVTPSRWTARGLLAGVLALTAVVFLPSLRYKFVYDDTGQIIDNALVHAWRFVPEYFRGHVWEYLYPNAAGNYYRPLNVLWLRINYAAFGEHPMGWHATTIALHLVATALAFAVARRITGQALTAAITALFFGLHPTRHEVVAWISGSTESICAVFFLSAFLAYLISRERSKTAWMSISLLLYVAALLSKETSIVLPGLIAAHAFLYGAGSGQDSATGLWKRASRAVALASLYVPLAILYLVLRVHVLRGFSHPLTAMSLGGLFLTIPSVLWFYASQWLLPIHFSESYDLAVRTGWDVAHVLFPLGALSTIAGLLWLFRQKLGSRELAFALAATAFPLLPVLYIPVFSAGELVHDRYAYLPGFGGALLVALALQQLCSGQMLFGVPRRLVFALLVIILPLSYSTANASSYWVDDYSLFEHAHRTAPDNILAKCNYAVELVRNGEKGEGLLLLQSLVKDHPAYFLANYNLGRLLYEANMMGPAYFYLQQARSIMPDMPDTYLQLGLVCMKTMRQDEALSYFKTAESIRPADSKIHFALGAVWSNRKNCTQARAEFSEALTLDPKLTKAREQMDKCTVTVAEGDNIRSSGANDVTGQYAAPLSRPMGQPLLPVKE